MKKVDIKEGHYYEILHANGDIKGAIGRAQDIEENGFGHVWLTVKVITVKGDYKRRLRGTDVREFVPPEKKRRGNQWVTDVVAKNTHILQEAQLMDQLKM